MYLNWIIKHSPISLENSLIFSIPNTVKESLSWENAKRIFRNIWTPASIRAQPESFGQARQDPVEQKCKNIKKAKIFEMFTQIKKTLRPQSLLWVFLYIWNGLSHTLCRPSVQTSRQLKQQFTTPKWSHGRVINNNNNNNNNNIEH